MKYLLYLWRSILRRPKRHFTLYSILTCAFLLPLVISISRDSSAYGREQFLLDQSKGAAFHIANATQEDVRYFEDIPGLSQPFYEEGTIYLCFLSDDEWKDNGNALEYSNKLFERMSLTNNERLVPMGFDYYSAHGISTDPAAISEQRGLFILNLFIILISVLIVRSAYKNHLEHFSPEIGTLISCGANLRQVRNIFIAEYLAVFPLAAVSSILLSAGVMRLLFIFLETKNVTGLAWMIFHMDPVNTALHVLIYFIASAVALGTALWRYGRMSTWTLLHSDTLTSKTVRRKQIDITPPPSAALSRFWRSRTNGSLYGCLLITVPVVTIFLVLFINFMQEEVVSTAELEYEFQMDKDVSQFGGFSGEDIEYIEKIAGVSQVQIYQEYIPAEYVFMECAGSEVVSRLYIVLDDPDIHGRIRDILQERFSGAEYKIYDRQEPVDHMRRMSKGMYLLLAYLFCILFLFILIILYIKICDYIEGRRDTIRSLYAIGASRRDLYHSYMRQILPTALAAAIIPIVVSEILSVLIAGSAYIPAAINGIAVLVYIVIVALICGFYLYPAHRTLKNILRKL